MNGMTKHFAARFLPAATFLSAAMLFSGAAQAMEIRQFDKMADQDQAEYVGLLMSPAGDRHSDHLPKTPNAVLGVHQRSKALGACRPD